MKDATAAAEYMVYFNPTCEKYGYSNQIKRWYGQAASEEEAVRLAGPMSKLVSVAALAHVDADFGQMSASQIFCAKKVVREQMGRGEVTRTGFDYLVATIDSQDAVEFIEANLKSERVFAEGYTGQYGRFEDVYLYRGVMYKIWWAGVSSGYAGFKCRKIVRTVTLKTAANNDAEFDALWLREQGRFECEESIEKASGADLITVDPSVVLVNDSGLEDESGLWKYEIETRGKRTENVTGFITVDSIEHGKKHVEEVSAQSAIRCGEKLTGRAWLLRLNDIEVPFTVSTVLAAKS